MSGQRRLLASGVAQLASQLPPGQQQQYTGASAEAVNAQPVDAQAGVGSQAQPGSGASEETIQNAEAQAVHPPAEHAEADAEPGQAAAAQLQPQAPGTEQATASVTSEEFGQEDAPGSEAGSQEGGPGKVDEPQQATASVLAEEPVEAGSSQQAPQRPSIAGGVTAQGTKVADTQGNEGDQSDETEQGGAADAAGEALGAQLEAAAEAADHG